MLYSMYPSSFSQASANKLDILLAPEPPTPETSSASMAQAAAAQAAAAQAALEAEEACREAERRLAQMWMDKDSGFEKGWWMVGIWMVINDSWWLMMINDG